MVRIVAAAVVVFAVSAYAGEQREVEAKNSVTVELSAGAALFGSAGTPSAVGLDYEHRFGQLGLALGARVSANGMVFEGAQGFGGIGAVVEPGIRWHFASGKGLWLGLSVPVAGHTYRGGGLKMNSVGVGIAPTLGFKHLFESGLVLQIFGGPEGTASWNETTQLPVGSQGGYGGVNRSLALRLRTGVGVGWAF